MEENEICSLLFHHQISCISIATIDLFQPKLYCYVANQDALQRNAIRSDQQDRRLYLFECCDLLQTRKLIDETKKRFRVHKGQKTTKQKLDEPKRPETDSSPSIPPRPHRLPPPPTLPHYLNPHWVQYLTRLRKWICILSVNKSLFALFIFEIVFIEVLIF